MGRRILRRFHIRGQGTEKNASPFKFLQFRDDVTKGKAIM